jgi:CHAT domain-containing protein/tetratricopeptide (TPR) repeat protein
MRKILCAVLLAIAMVHVQASSIPKDTKEYAHQVELLTKLHKEHRWNELIQLMPGLIDTYRNVPGFHLLYADALREMKRFPEAIEHYQIVRRLQPDNPLAYQGEGWALLQEKDFDAAEAVIVTGMKAQPKFHSFLHTSLVINWMRGNRQLAFERLSALEKVEPELARKAAQGLGMRKTANSDDSPSKTENNSDRQFLDRAKTKLLERDPGAAIMIVAPLYFVESSQRMAPLLDMEAGDILLLAYAMNGDFVDMISIYGDLGKWTNVDEYAFGVYEQLSANHGTADQLAVRALIASIIVSSSTGRLHVGLQRGLDGMLRARESNLHAEDKSMLLLAIGQTYAFLGRVADEARAVDQAVSLLADSRSKLSEQQTVALALSGLSKFKRFDYVGAAKDLDVVIESLERLKQLNTPFGATLLLARAQLLVVEKKYDEVVKLQKRSGDAMRIYHSQLKRTFPKAKLGELGRGAWLSQAFGHFDLSVKQWELAVKFAKEYFGPANSSSLHAEAQLASAFIRAGKVQEARTLLKSLIPRIEESRTNGVLTEEDRQQLFGNVVASYKDYAWLLVGQDNSHSFEIAELAKARTLLESTLMRRANLSGLLPNSEFARLRDLENQLSQLTEKNAASRGAGKLDFALQSEQQKLEAEYRDFRLGLLKHFPKYARHLEFTFPGVKAISSRLSEDEILVSYLVTPKVLLLYAVTRDGLTVKKVDVPSSKLRGLIAAARANFSGQLLDIDSEVEPPVSKLPADTIQAVDAERDLAKYLLLPIKDVLTNKRVITFSPDDALAIFPFDALVLDGKRLIESFDIGYSQSASVFFLNRGESTELRKHNFDMLAIGGPAYESRPRNQEDSVSRAPQSRSSEFELSIFLGQNRGNPEVVSAAFQSLKGRWVNLPGAEKEAEEVGALFQQTRRTVITGLAASEAKLQGLSSSGELRKYKYLLLSTHGYLSLHEPALSAIVLSQVETTPRADGYITASEWAGYDLHSELVVLSACDTGVGKVVQGEGVTGLPYALSIAGNRRTVVSLWPVMDDSTKVFMLSFFTKIRDGKSIGNALGDTKREFLRNPEFSAPQYWAPFVLYGS